MRFFSLFLFTVLASCLSTEVNGFLWDKEVEIVKSEWSSVVVVVRHVEYIGVNDNGTLDCSVPGFTKYRWTVINKVTKEGFTDSSVMGAGEKSIPESQSSIKIGDDGFPLVNDLMVVSCEALVGLNPRMQIIWAITRLHSPLGFPTDPRVCDFGGKTFETNCTWYQWTYKTDCYYDKGLEYTGTVNHARHRKCKYWHMATGAHNESYVIAKLMGIYDKGGHDYCRNMPVNPTCYLKEQEIDSCRRNILTQPWCYSDDDPNENKYKFHYCNVEECSSCMYGNGDGAFKLYPGRKFPAYLGRSIKTTKKRNGNPVLCQQGVGWQDNVCRASLTIRTASMDKPHVVTKATPHCYVAKPGADATKIFKVPDKNLELARCKFRQCTVRQVWFLFFNSYGEPFVMESNFKGVKIELVSGRKEERIKFAAFGIHLVSGLKLGSKDYRVSNFLRSFSLTTRRPPAKMSELVIKNVKRQYSGQYFMEYKFAEADPTIDKAIYKVNFEIDVKQPTSFSMNPSILKVCLKGEGKITANVNGYFSILEDTITWKYGSSRKSIKTDIVPQNTRFELSANARSLVIKKVTEELWVSVEGRSYSGLTSAIAHVALKDQPFLKAVSSIAQYALPGDDVTLVIENNQLQRVTWVFDAMVISSLPDDPNMGFRRVPRGDHVVTSLVISDVREHHYGNYYVEAILDGCKSVITFQVKHASENPELVNQVATKPPMPTSFNRTGLWCTDELDPYAFHFDIDFNSVMTIGAFRNEPLTESQAVEIQHYSIQHSVDKLKWTRFILKDNNSRIPYTFLGNKAYWLPVPLTTRFIRVYPGKMDSVACMKVRFFGCVGNTLDCDEIKQIKAKFHLGFLIGIPSGVLLLIVASISIILWKRNRSIKEQEAKRKKASKRKRKHKDLDDAGDSKKGKSKKKRERLEKVKEKDYPKVKRRRYSSDEETSFELDSEEEREIRRKAKLKAKKKEIEWEEKFRLKRKIERERKKGKRKEDEMERESDEENSEKGKSENQKSDKGKSDNKEKKRRKDGKKKDRRKSSSRAMKTQRSSKKRRRRIRKRDKSSESISESTSFSDTASTS